MASGQNCIDSIVATVPENPVVEVSESYESTYTSQVASELPNFDFMGTEFQELFSPRTQNNMTNCVVNFNYYGKQ